jgi:hypothetical protein
VRSSQPPLEYLMTCSQSALEGFELARLDEVSRLRAELRSLPKNGSKPKLQRGSPACFSMDIAPSSKVRPTLARDANRYRMSCQRRAFCQTQLTRPKSWSVFRCPCFPRPIPSRLATR